MPEEQREAQYLTGVRVYDVVYDDAGYQSAMKIKQDINALKGFINRAAKKEKTREVLDAEAALEKYTTELDRIEAARETRRKKEK